MNLKEQLYICTLAECGTISKAAEKLYISPPALSVYLSNLEKYLGAKLFERTGKCLTPTLIGIEYLSRAEQMLKLKEEFDSLVEQISGNCKGIIKIGIQHRRAITVAPYLTACFIKEYPNISLVFKEGVHGELMKMYRDNTVDFMVCIYSDEIAEAACVDLKSEQVLIALPENHSARIVQVEGDYFPHVDFSDLKDQVFILPAKNQSLRMTAEKILEHYRIRPARIIEISNFETAMSMVEHGIGIAFNRKGYIDSMPQFTKLKYCLIGEQAYCSRLVLAYRKGKVQSPHVERFIELLKECISKT